MLPGLGRPLSGVGSSALPAVVFQSNTISTSSNTTYTFSSVGIGAASATRYVIVGVYIGSTSPPTFSSATIGGSSAAQLGSAVFSSNTGCVFYGRTVNSGTTANIVINLSSSAARCSISVWTMENINTPVVNTSTTDNTLTSSTTLNSTLNVADNSVVFAMCAGAGNGNRSSTWVGVMESFDTTITTSPSYNDFSGGAQVYPFSQTGLAISDVFSGTKNNGVFTAINLK